MVLNCWLFPASPCVSAMKNVPVVRMKWLMGVAGGRCVVCHCVSIAASHSPPILRFVMLHYHGHLGLGYGSTESGQIFTLAL